MSKPPTAFDLLIRGGLCSIRRCLGGLLTFLVIVCSVGPAPAQSEIEFKVKAAFLYNFAKFTDWPPDKLAFADSFVIGCFSDPEFLTVLEATVAGKTLGSRRIMVKRVTGVDDLRACHVLFVGRSKDDSAAAFLTRAKDLHVLTVGEADGFASRGGMIGFVSADGGVKFAINAAQTEGAGLKLSSKLLTLAVNDGGGNRR